MVLRRLEAERFRNLTGIRLELEPGLTVVVGENAQGKTSLLEAAYLLATGRSFRTRKLDEVVGWPGGPARVAGEVDSRRGAHRLAVTVDAGARRLLADGAEVELEAFLGRLDVVDLTAERMRVVRGSPDERRRFLDRGALGLRPSYLRDLGRFRRTLGHRNALLRRGGGGVGATELEAWDERLVAAAGALHVARRAYAEAVDRRLDGIAAELLPGKRHLSVRYAPSPASGGDATPSRYAEILAEGLALSRTRDLALGHTSQGPHRDDLRVELDGVDLKRFGSSGQVRAAMVALKLAKLSLFHEEHGDPPLFLMDDFDTDLDEVRASALADFLRRGGFQALVATSKETLSARLGAARTKLRMDGGVARRLE